MKIKIPPYPSFKITEQAFQRDVISNSVSLDNASDLDSNQLVLITQFKTGEKRVIRCRAVRHKSKLYITSFPNPVHLFLSLAIEHYNNSENVKENNFPTCGKKFGDDMYLLDFEEEGTHECYNHYVKYRASSIIMLVSALEAFLNQIIPDNFIYNKLKDSKEISLNKTQIESSKVSFADKLLNVIPSCLDKPNFWDNLTKEKILIDTLYSHRKNFIHLKTNVEDDFTRYFDVIDKMLDFDISASIDATILFMNSASDNYVEIDKSK